MSLYASDSALFTQILLDYTLHQKTLENYQTAKYLRITIKWNMDLVKHISDIPFNATMTLGFLRLNLAFTPRRTNEVAITALVRPELEYDAPILGQKKGISPISGKQCVTVSALILGLMSSWDCPSYQCHQTKLIHWFKPTFLSILTTRL